MTTQTSRRPYTGRRPHRDFARPTGRPSFTRDRSNRRPASRGRSGRVQPTFDPSKFINTNPVEQKPEAYEATHTFRDFSFDARIVANIDKLGISTPSPIQDQIIPHILKSKDVVGLAETGTGKTAAFLLPLIERTFRGEISQTLILTPTRELALQVEAEFRKFAYSLGQFATTCVGGTNIQPQIRALSRRNHFIIGTPGRVLDLIERKHIKPEKITSVVLDEADRMLDMGFIHDMRKILERVPSTRQTLFFSATMTNEAKQLVSEFMQDPVTISVKKKDVTNSILQDVVRYENVHKFDTLVTLLGKAEFKRVIIFGAMKHSVEKLANELSAAGIKATSIHGNKSHSQRQRALQAFKGGQARVLVATDVAARGIHVDNVTHVINYDLPNTFEDYVHRIGRTGRGNESGMALTFIPSHTR